MPKFTPACSLIGSGVASGAIPNQAETAVHTAPSASHSGIDSLVLAPGPGL